LKEGQLYHNILTPIDLSEPAMTQKGIAAAIEIAKIGKARIRLVYVQSLMPLAFMEYAPADFDERVRESTEGELARRRSKSTTRRNWCRRRCVSARFIRRFSRKPRLGERI
jgi:hypothetical protein